MVSSHPEGAGRTLVLNETSGLGLIDPAWRPALGQTEAVEHAGEAVGGLYLHDSPPFIESVGRFPNVGGRSVQLVR